MPQRQDVTQVLVVADDFTGANDAGVGLALNHVRVNVILDERSLGKGALHEVTVMNTDSRAVGAETAAQRTAQAVALWRNAGGRGWVFKKIDSTLRGNLGAEIDAALTASDAPIALVAPAIPALGRVTRAGQVWLNGRRLTDTEFVSDPKTPVRSADIGARLAEQSALRQATLSVSELNHPDVVSQIQQRIRDGVRLLIIDAESEQDLDSVMAIALALPIKPLLVGAAGLSDALARRLHFPPRSGNAVLAVIGSMSEIAQKQIAAIDEPARVALIDVDVRQLLIAPASSYDEQICLAATEALASGRHCVIRTCRDETQRFAVERLCQQFGLSRQQLGETLCRFLGRVTRRIVAARAPAGLYLSGGDVAIAVAAALGAKGFQIKGQIASCVPWGRFIESAAGDIPVMTKAGGFGNSATLHDVLRFIEERVSE